MVVMQVERPDHLNELHSFFFASHRYDLDFVHCFQFFSSLYRLTDYPVLLSSVFINDKSASGLKWNILPIR